MDIVELINTAHNIANYASYHFRMNAFNPFLYGDGKSGEKAAARLAQVQA